MLENPVFSYEIGSLLLNLSLEAYQSDEKFSLDDETLVKVDSFHHKDTNAHCYIIERQDHEEIFITFRGAPSMQVLIKDVVAKKTVYPEGQEGFFQSRVHKGALDAYLTINGDILSSLKGLQTKGKNQKIYTTGHGFGAALATLCAFDIKQEIDDFEVAMYNFGSIRTGNLTFSRRFNKLVPEAYRIVNNEDFCARFPKLGYKHVGHLVFISLNKLRVDPSRFFQFLENLDNPIGIISGAAFMDHLPDKYKRVMSNLEEIKPGKLWKKKENL